MRFPNHLRFKTIEDCTTLGTNILNLGNRFHNMERPIGKLVSLLRRTSPKGRMRNKNTKQLIRLSKHIISPFMLGHKMIG